MNPYLLFLPPPLQNKTHVHIDESQETIIDTTIQGPAPVKLLDPSQGSFAQISESPNQNFVVNIVQYETHKAYLPNCVTSYFTYEQKLKHQGNANVIQYHDDPTYHALCVETIASQ